jgi:hypothetical protein
MRNRHVRLMLVLVTIMAARPLMAEHRGPSPCQNYCAEGWSCCAWDSKGGACCSYDSNTCCYTIGTSCETSSC